MIKPIHLDEPLEGRFNFKKNFNKASKKNNLKSTNFRRSKKKFFDLTTNFKRKIDNFYIISFPNVTTIDSIEINTTKFTYPTLNQPLNSLMQHQFTKADINNMEVKKGNINLKVELEFKTFQANLKKFLFLAQFVLPPQIIYFLYLIDYKDEVKNFDFEIDLKNKMKIVELTTKLYDNVDFMNILNSFLDLLYNEINILNLSNYLNGKKKMFLELITSIKTKPKDFSCLYNYKEPIVWVNNKRCRLFTAIYYYYLLSKNYYVFFHRNTMTKVPGLLRYLFNNSHLKPSKGIYFAIENILDNLDIVYPLP